MSTSLFDRHYFDSKNWKLGFIYFCKEDPRVLVPKRIRGLGWTLNFARPMAVPFLIFLVALAVVVPEFLRVHGTSREHWVGAVLLATLATIALCYHLSKTKCAPAPTAEPASGEDADGV